MYNYHKHIKKGEEEVKKEKLQRIEEMQKESRKSILFLIFRRGFRIGS